MPMCVLATTVTVAVASLEDVHAAQLSLDPPKGYSWVGERVSDLVFAVRP